MEYIFAQYIILRFQLTSMCPLLVVMVLTNYSALSIFTQSTVYVSVTANIIKLCTNILPGMAIELLFSTVSANIITALLGVYVVVYVVVYTYPDQKVRRFRFWDIQGKILLP